MKKLTTLLLMLAAAVACSRSETVPFEEVRNYFFRNDAAIPSAPKVDSAEGFESLFGAAAFMGKDGTPTAIDFDKEFVIAVVDPKTDVATELTPVSLEKRGDELIFTYKETLGEKLGWTMQPLLLVKVGRSHDAPSVKLVRQQ